jgi:uncharacterized protein with ACT and thioredoxin-like domain
MQSFLTIPLVSLVMLVSVPKNNKTVAPAPVQKKVLCLCLMEKH